MFFSYPRELSSWIISVFSCWRAPEREAGARAREKPSVTDYGALGYNTRGCLETFPRCWRRVPPLCGPASAPLLPRSLCRFTGSERAGCPSLHRLPLALVATCVLGYVVVALIANTCCRLPMCHCAKRFTHVTSLSLLRPCEGGSAILSSQVGKLNLWRAVTYPGGACLVSGTAGIWTQVCSPRNHLF